MYQDKPWSLTKEEKKNVKKETSKKKVSNAKPNFFTEDLAVSSARVLKLFKENKEKYYSNLDISVELGMSSGTVSNVTNRLEALGEIKIVKVRQLVSALSQVFQYKSGSMVSVEKEKAKKDTARLVKDLFENDKNAVYTKQDIMQALPKCSKGQIEESIRILLLNETLKLLLDFEGGSAKYQHFSGNRKGIKVHTEHDLDYITLKEFLKKVDFNYNKEEFLKRLPEKCRAFYSSKGIVIEYLKSDLEECLEKSKKKNFLERMFG